MSKLQVFALQPSPTDSVMSARTAFRRHLTLIRNSAVPHKILPTWNGFGADFELRDLRQVCWKLYHISLLRIQVQTVHVLYIPIGLGSDSCFSLYMFPRILLISLYGLCGMSRLNDRLYSILSILSPTHTFILDRHLFDNTK